MVVRVHCCQVEGTDIMRVVIGIDSLSKAAPASVFYEDKVEEVLLTWPKG